MPPVACNERLELFTYMTLEKMSLTCMVFFFELTCIVLKRIFLTSMVFRPLLALDGVKS